MLPSSSQQIYHKDRQQDTPKRLCTSSKVHVATNLKITDVTLVAVRILYLRCAAQRFIPCATSWKFQKGNHTALTTKDRSFEPNLTHCGRVTQICVFNTVKLGTSASSSQCHSTRGNASRGITPSSTTRVFGEYFLKISVHKNSQGICYKFLKKHSIKFD